MHVVWPLLTLHPIFFFFFSLFNVCCFCSTSLFSSPSRTSRSLHIKSKAVQSLYKWLIKARNHRISFKGIIGLIFRHVSFLLAAFGEKTDDSFLISALLFLMLNSFPWFCYCDNCQTSSADSLSFSTLSSAVLKKSTSGLLELKEC